MITWVFYLYAAIGLASLVILIIMLVFGGLDLDFDFGDVDVDVDTGLDVGFDGGPGFFSLPILLGFFTGFGGIGALLTYYEVNVIATPFIAGLGAILIASILFLIVNYFFKHFQSDSTVRFNNLIGRKASVSVPIAPGQEGQVVLFTEQRGRTLVPAVSKKSLPNNAQVVITGVSGDTVKVISLSEWKKKKRKKEQFDSKGVER
jgi:membrane protein implicated in regulation of membrane protease activity